MNNLNVSKALVVMGDNDVDVVEKSAGNVPDVKTTQANTIKCIRYSEI